MSSSMGVKIAAAAKTMLAIDYESLVVASLLGIVYHSAVQVHTFDPSMKNRFELRFSRNIKAHRKIGPYQAPQAACQK